MKEEKIETKMEVFVCQFGKECCKKGGPELADKLKKWAKEEHKGEIKVYRSGCLSQCDNACALAIYPQKKFWIDLKEKDFEEIKKGLEEALKKLG